MNRRTAFLLCGGLALVVLTGILAQFFTGTRPFKDLTAGDIQAVKLELFPPSAEFNLTPEEIEELAPLLNDVVVYRRDDSWRDYDGQLCRFTLILADGSQTTVSAYNPFLIVDGVGRRTKYEPCEALNHFANTLRD
ncbi:MAG: hypothetical protein K2P01_07330 [Oscillospiraceae bacterium]|nr:hypothetical protein [Oscillospiraceae bacterium]